MKNQRDGSEERRAGEGLRDDVISYVRTFSRGKGKPPSVRMILKKFRINRTEFYGTFEGMDELCELAGVGAVEERNTQVIMALEAKQRKGLGQEEENPEEAVKSALSDFEQEIERSKFAAIQDPSKTFEYASKVVPELDPTLWRRLELLSDDLSNRIYVTMLSKGNYMDLLRNAKVTNQKVPEFQEYVMGALRDLVSSAMKRGGFSSAPPGDAVDTCILCNSRLLYSKPGASSPLFCRSCNNVRSAECPVCETNMEALPPNMLKCGKCGYRMIFKEELRKQISTAEEYFDEVAAGRMPAEAEGKVYFTQRLPDGRTSYIPVDVRPGNVPGRVRTELDLGREFIA